MVRVLVKYGFAEIVDRMNLAPYVRLGRRLLRRGPESHLTAAQRIRMALEELGPTFVKFGQVLSTRPFLIPPDLVVELSKLQDEVAPLPFESMKLVLEEELGDGVQEHFRRFDERPLASASIAQTYKAQTATGDWVVVKIQRPGIRRIIETDMEILRDFANLLLRTIPESQRYDPLGLVEEFTRTIRRELDFINEARNVELFARNFKGVEEIHVPKIYWQMTRQRVLTLEYIDGIKISDVRRLDELGYDRKQIARNGARLILKQIFEDGFFHADPHPGNLFVLPGNVIAPVDFGQMGYLDDFLMNELSDLLIGTLRRDVDLILQVFEDLGATEDRDMVPMLRMDISEFLNRYYGVPLARLDVRRVLEEAFEIFQRNDLRLPSNLTLLAKALGTYEELGRLLDPDFDMFSEVKPYLKDLLRRRFQPQRLSYDVLKSAINSYELFRVLPREIQRLLTRVKRGDISFIFRHRGLENLILELDRASNRLSFSLIIAALILASSLVIRSNLGPFLFGYPLLGIIGYLFAGVLGIWLVLAILRSGKL